MPTLVVLADPLKGERSTHELREGETLAAALMRLWPGGLTGGWRIYREMVSDANELAAVRLPFHPVLAGETYVIVRDLAGQVFLANLAMSLMFSLAAQALTPKPPRILADTPDTLSANNMIAGQSNQLRPGARVPDILGRVRAFPDLLCNPVDVYNETSQTIGQMFVLGAGDYEVTDPKLGETPLASVRGSDIKTYLRGETIPDFFVLKTSREVGHVSLLSEVGDTAPISGDVDFFAATHEMHTQEPLTIGLGRPVRISGTFFNNGVFWVDSVPPITQTAPPFVYLLDGPVSDEIGAEAAITQIPASITFGTRISYGNAGPFDWTTPGGDEKQVQFPYGWPGDEKIPKVGDHVELRTKAGQMFRGRVTQAVWPLGGPAHYWGLTFNDTQGNPLSFPTLSNKDSQYTSFREPAVGDASDPAPGGGELTNAPTNWYAAPMPSPQEIWIDIAFPQGLAFYDHGARREMTVVVMAEFRRLGLPDDPPQATVTFPPFSYGTNAPLRFTKRVPVIGLALPAGSATIEVRLTRVTPFRADTSNNNYVQETRWERLAAVRKLIGQVYETATILAFTMSNTRTAGAVGDMSLNVIATRILPTWTGSAWSAPAATRKWADNFVARSKAHDGAFRTDEQLDLAGIYALQAELETMDAGAVGQISLTLDAMQDIDAELAAIADVARAVIYRVGRKIFVARDQANPTRLALFNARAKNPDGETVTMRMTGDSDNDCVVVQWVDEFSAWKKREFQYPPEVVPQNPLRLPVMCANWPQVWRRAVYEWNRLKYRREALSCQVSEDGRMCRVGDVVNVTDDTSNLATCAGELVRADGSLLTLDRDVVPIETGDTFTILLRDVEGLRVDTVECTPVAGHPDQVQLARTATVELKGRDASRGTLFAVYRNGAATTRPWMIVSTAAGGPYVQLSAVNYTDKVYTGDTAPLPLRPIMEITL